MEEGKRVSPSVPYGYYRNPNNKQQLLVDKESAKVVKCIYRIVIEGYWVTQIADILIQHFEQEIESYYQRKVDIDKFLKMIEKYTDID